MFNQTFYSEASLPPISVVKIHCSIDYKNNPIVILSLSESKKNNMNFMAIQMSDSIYICDGFWLDAVHTRYI